MEESVSSFCIAIASHMSNPKRISYLLECFDSLLKQTIVIPIYLSISFENDDIKTSFIEGHGNMGFINHPSIHMLVQSNKTPQMRHFLSIIDVMKPEHKWIMFCDDDDTYDPIRVENLIKSIYIIKQQITDPTKIFAGLYESHCEKDHREHRHEYWCYCVDKSIIERFYAAIMDHPDIIDNKCCDVLFGEYLRRLSPEHFFGRLDMRLYQYRVTENQDSVTGVIQARQSIYTKNEAHPLIGDPKLPDYILDWNDYLYENLDVYLHDVFLRTIVGCDMDYILRMEFRNDYDLLSYVDESHANKMREKHEYWRSICAKLYDVKL